MLRSSQKMLGAGLEPAWNYVPRDFKSLASTHFAIRANTRKGRGTRHQYTKLRWLTKGGSTSGDAKHTDGIPNRVCDERRERRVTAIRYRHALSVHEFRRETTIEIGST